MKVVYHGDVPAVCVCTGNMPQKNRELTFYVAGL